MVRYVIAKLQLVYEFSVSHIGYPKKLSGTETEYLVLRSSLRALSNHGKTSLKVSFFFFF